MFILFALIIAACCFSGCASPTPLRVIILRDDSSGVVSDFGTSFNTLTQNILEAYENAAFRFYTFAEGLNDVQPSNEFLTSSEVITIIDKQRPPINVSGSCLYDSLERIARNMSTSVDSAQPMRIVVLSDGSDTRRTGNTFSRCSQTQWSTVSEQLQAVGIAIDVVWLKTGETPWPGDPELTTLANATGGHILATLSPGQESTIGHVSIPSNASQPVPPILLVSSVLLGSISFGIYKWRTRVVTGNTFTKDDVSHLLRPEPAIFDTPINLDDTGTYLVPISDTPIVMLQQYPGQIVGRQYPILNFPFRIGRSGPNSTNDLILDDDKHVSKHHAEIICRDNVYYILDCQSQNGTFIDHTRIRPGVAVRLTNGTYIGLGDRTILLFTTISAPVSVVESDNTFAGHGGWKE